MKLTDIIRSLTGAGPSLALTYAATVNLDFAAHTSQTLTLAGNVTFTTSNRAAGRRIDLLVTADASIRTLTFPAGWRFIGAAAPANIAASKVGMLRVRAYGTADANVVAEWVVEL